RDGHVTGVKTCALPIYEEARVIPRLLGGMAGWCARRPWLVLGLTLLSCALALHANFTSLEFETQRNDLIGPNKACFQRWQQYVEIGRASCRERGQSWLW